MTVRLGISVEGPTEEFFIKRVVVPHLATFHVYATPIPVETSRSASGKKFKGGGIKLDLVKKELRRILEGYPDGYVSSLYDFYGFDGKDEKDTVDKLEIKISQALNSPRNFISYVQLHEFESLLLSDSAVLSQYFQAPKLENIVQSVVDKAGSPERVNDSVQTAPSKRLRDWTKDYSPEILKYSDRTKTKHGPRLAELLTLPTIRAACPRFHAWINRLEGLDSQ